MAAVGLKQESVVEIEDRMVTVVSEILLDPEALIMTRVLTDAGAVLNKSHTALPAAPSNRAATASAPQPAVDVVAALVEVVAQTTGYPRETLELGMDMEADLGIDSIKRVEILSLLSKRVPNAPSVNPEKLSALRTLQQVVDFIRSASPAPAPAPTPAPTPAPALSATPSLSRRVVRPIQLGPRADAAPAFPSREILVHSGHALSEPLVAALTARGARARLFSDAADVTGPVGGLVVFAPDGSEWTPSQ